MNRGIVVARVRTGMIDQCALDFLVVILDFFDVVQCVVNLFGTGAFVVRRFRAIVVHSCRDRRRLRVQPIGDRRRVRENVVEIGHLFDGRSMMVEALNGFDRWVLR